MRLLCATHTLAPLDALSAQVPTGCPWTAQQRALLHFSSLSIFLEPLEIRETVEQMHGLNIYELCISFLFSRLVWEIFTCPRPDAGRAT